MVDHALELAARGFAVFPLAPRSKVPIAGSRGCLDATRDPDRIVRMWQREPHANIGLATGGASGVWVLDVDDRHDGAATMRGLVGELGPLPPTLRARTGSGWHLYFRLDGAVVRQGANVLGPGVDTRSTGGYVVAPPSIHPSGARYRWLTDLAPAVCPPKWLARLAPRPAPAAPRFVPARAGVDVDVLGRARRYLAVMEPSVQGQGGSTRALWAAVAMVRGFALDADTALALLLSDAWNARCLPPWSERELRHKVASADRSSKPLGFLLNAPRRVSRAA
jgi:hypothetical protein